MVLSVIRKRGANEKKPLLCCVLLHLDGRAEALKHPVAAALLTAGWELACPELRGSGTLQPRGDAVRTTPDHNTAEHALWVGRPLLGQWVFETRHLVDWLATQDNVGRIAVAGVGQAGVVALCAGSLGEPVQSVAAVDSPASFVTDQEYAAGARMGLLAPGMLRVGDIPHLAALVAPRQLQIIGGLSSQGKRLDDKALKEFFAFTAEISALHGKEARLTVAAEKSAKEIAEAL
jgi:hypothetical protein